MMRLQVTLEIDTNPHRGRDQKKKSGNEQGEQSKASADEEEGKVAESFQLPVELLD